MGLMVKKQPIIFADALEEEPVPGEQTMDLLLHYAQSGLGEVEQLMRDQPDQFSPDEIMDFAANKVVLAKAPDILEEYKKKVREFEYLHEKMQGVVGKCEKIVRNYDIRKNHDSDNYVDPHAKPKQVVHEKPEPGVIRYTKDGQVLLNSNAPVEKPVKKYVIELPKHGNY